MLCINCEPKCHVIYVSLKAGSTSHERQESKEDIEMSSFPFKCRELTYWQPTERVGQAFEKGN